MSAIERHMDVLERTSWRELPILFGTTDIELSPTPGSTLSTILQHNPLLNKEITNTV